LTSGGHTLDKKHMADLTRQCAALHEAGVEIIICSSGSIAVGRSRLGFPSLPSTIQSKQIFAAVGQSRLMLTWEQLFENYEIPVGQILLTRADVESPPRFRNAHNTLTGLLEQHIIPIVNENDAVAVEEIRLGDNDNLSALVSTLVSADLLIMLTDQPALFTADPRKNPDAQPIKVVDAINKQLMDSAGGTNTGLGVGGMHTKLEAAQTARHAGADVVIADGHATDIVIRVVNGEPVGTLFPAQTRSIEGRKGWVLAGKKPVGRLQIDAGAAQALSRDGRSLLSVGITGVYGQFKKNDAVCIVDENMYEVARGIVEYDNNAVQSIRGVRSENIPQILEGKDNPVVVHRDNMILLNERMNKGL